MKWHATADGFVSFDRKFFQRWYLKYLLLLFKKIPKKVFFFQTKEQRKRLDAEMLSVALFPTDPLGVVRQRIWVCFWHVYNGSGLQVSIPKINRVSCSSDISEDGCANKVHSGTEPLDNRILSKQVLVLDAEVILKAHKFVPLIPEPIADALSCSPLPAERYYFWWRAIAAAYMIRPNLVKPCAF